MVVEGRPVEDVTSKVASPTTPEVPPRETNIDARLQAIVRRILSQTVKQVLNQEAIENTQKSSKRQKIQSTTPSSSSKGVGFKANLIKESRNLPHSQPPMTPNARQRNLSLICYGCHESGHTQARCPRPNLVCYGCGGNGHRLSYCPRRQGGP